MGWYLIVWAHLLRSEYSLEREGKMHDDIAIQKFLLPVNRYRNGGHETPIGIRIRAV